jgi:hypothetical protein
MAWIKLSNGGVNQVDDDELRDLILAGAGEEIDEPAPGPVAPPPVGSANDPNNHSARIKELMDYASSFDASGTPEAISRVKAEANREIEKLHAKYGTGSVPQWVRSQLSGGATKRQSKFGAATDMLNSVFDPMERSKLAKNVRSAAGEFTRSYLHGDGPALPAIQAAKALGGESNMADEGLFGILQGSAQKAALDRAVVKPQDQLTDEEKAAVEADNASTVDATKQAVGAMASQVAENPNEFASQLAMDVLSPSNIAGEALTGPLGALTQRVVGATKTAQRARRLLDADPLVTGGSTYRRLPTIGAASRAAAQIGEETVQGAFSEAAQTGDVTAAGTITNMAPAVAGTALRGAAAASTPNAAKRTGNTEPPVSAQQPPVAPEPVAPVPEPAPTPGAVPVAPQAAPEPAPVAPTLRPSEARPYPQRGVQPRETDATRAAKKVARKEEAQAKSEAESQIAIHTKKAKEFAKAGMQADAEALLDKSRAHYDKVWGQSADFVFNKDKEILAAEAKKATSKPARQPKIDPPKTVVEAQKQVDAAIAEGTPEAIEAARPAIEVLNPVGDDAAKSVQDLKDQAESHEVYHVPGGTVIVGQNLTFIRDNGDVSPPIDKNSPKARELLAQIRATKDAPQSQSPIAEAPAPARAPKIEAPPEVAPEPVAPKAPKAKKPKTELTPKEDPARRPKIRVKDKVVDMGSVADRAKDPVFDDKNTFDIFNDATVMNDLKDIHPGIHKKTQKVMSDIRARRSEIIDTDEGDQVEIQDLIEAADDELGGDLQAALLDRSNQDFEMQLAAAGVDRQTFKEALDAYLFTDSELAVLRSAARELETLTTPVDPMAPDDLELKARRLADEARIEAEREIGPVPDPAKPDKDKGIRVGQLPKGKVGGGSKLYANPLDPELMKQAAMFAVDKIDEHIGFRTQRISDEFTQMTDEAMKRGGPVAAANMKSLTDMTRKMESETAKAISRRMTELDTAIRKISEPGLGIRGKDLEVISSALNGDKVTLNDWQQELHDVIRGILDDLGADGKAVYGFEPRKSYFPRIELRPVINDMIKNFTKQAEVSGVRKTLKQGPMDLQKAKATVAAFGKPADPAVARAIESQSTILQSLFEKDAAGNVSLAKDPDGVTKLQREAAYLLLMPKDGSLEPMMPDLFNKVGVHTGFDKKGAPVYGPPFTVELKPNVKMLSPDDMKTLMDAEAMRILENREEYDPEGNVQSYHNSAGKWYVDGSLTHSRLMPDLGKEFYEQSPINAVVHTIRAQTRGLERQRAFGRDKEILLDKLEPLAPYFTEEELGVVKTDEGYRLAEKGKTEGKTEAAYKRSLLRSIEDVATGTMRPENELGTAGEIIEKLARYAVLVGKLGPAVKNEILQAGAAGMYGPDVAAAYGSARAKVAAMQMESGLRRIGEKGARAARLAKVPSKWTKQALDQLVDGDPITQADRRNMADASGIIGATKGERFVAGAMNLIGSFSASNKAADIAAHYTGYAMFNDMLHRRNLDKAAFSKESGLLPDDLRRSMSEADLDKAAKLLDSQGWPASPEAAEAILKIADPFISEFKSKLSGRNTPLFTAKVAREKWARSPMWLMSIPLGITSGQIASIRRAVRNGDKLEAVNRAGKLAVAGATATYLSMLAAQDPEEASMLAAMATGQYVSAVGAQALNGFEYEPENEYANIEMASLQNDWDSDPAYGKLLNRLKIAGTLAGKSMWQPRFLDTRYASDAEMRLAKRRSIPKYPGDEAVTALLPAVDALANTFGNTYSDAKLARTALRGDRNGDAFRMLSGTLLPIVREGTGKLRANLKADEARFKQQDSASIVGAIEPLTGSRAADFIMSGIRTDLNKVPKQK